MRRRPPLSRLLSVAIACALTLAAVSVTAKDLGVRGAVWRIAEPDLLTEIEERLEVMEASGELARMRREAVERARESVEAPARVSGVVPARVRRTRLFDPSVTLERRRLRAADGTLLAARGARVNPLTTHPLTRDLLFIDATRPVEVAWALRHEKSSVIVLLAGRPLDLTRTHGRAFFLRPGRAAHEAFRAQRYAVRGQGCGIGPENHGSTSRRRTGSRWAKETGHEAPDIFYSHPPPRLRPARRSRVRAVVHRALREPRD